MHTTSAFKNAAATATFNDIWAGDLSAALVPFKTKRKGATVVRFRWMTERGGSVGIWANPFSSPSAGVAAAKRHPSFADVSAT